MKRAWVGLILFLVAVRVLAALLVPLTEPTEGRYAHIAGEMARSGDWVTPRIWHEGEHMPYLGKPPLHFWLTAGSMKLLGTTPFAARLPALVLGMLYLMFLCMTLRGEGRDTALRACLLTAGTVLFFILWGSAAVDLTVSVMISGAILAYTRFLKTGDGRTAWCWSLAVFLLLALGFLTKGPVALILFGMPVFLWTLLNRQWRSLRHHAWLTGSLLFLAVTAPWFIACELRNPGFLNYFLVNENFLRFVTPTYGDRYGTGHVYFRGMAILMFLGTALPWSLALVAPAWRFIKGPRRRLTREPFRTPLAGLCLLGILSNVLFWCLARQLLATYLMPAVLLFCVVLACRLGSGSTDRTLTRISVAIAVSYAALLLCFGPTIKDRFTARAITAATRVEPQATTRPLLFIRRTPYAADLYARGAIVHHPTEEVRRSFARGEPGEYMYLFTPLYFARLSSEERRYVRVLLKTPDVIVAEKRAVRDADGGREGRP